MCGINGFNYKDEKLISMMNKTIKHRGPDDCGEFLDDSVSLGHLRLSIQDLSSLGHQPMKYKHLTIVFNGEIYNFIELRDELKKLGHKFKSRTDTEVILAAYLEWGSACLEKFNGMWAFCIYDSIRKELFLSRDRFGKKPLYYYNKNGKFIFSSEIKSILANNRIKRVINKKSLNEFFSYRFTFEDRTIFENIFNFKPGSYMIFDLSSSKILTYHKFYEIKYEPQSLSFNDAKVKTLELIEQSVKRRMVSDVPVGCFLSGGIDSSIIAYYAKKFNPDLNTFSVGFDTTNELSYAKLVSDKLETNHFEYIINKDNVMNYIEDMVYHMDEPIGADPGFLPIFVLSKKTKKHNRVVLTGDGSDEIFVGYDRYKLFYYGKILKHFAFHDFDNEILKRLQLMRGKDDFESFIEITRVFESKELKRLGIEEEFKLDYWPKGRMSPLIKAQIFDIENLLVKDFFMKADKMSSAFGLEQRTPFMDHELVEFALGLPIDYKIRFWNEKYILKKAFKDILPQEILNRPKHGFNVPIDYWFKGVLGDKLEDLIKNRKHELYKKEYAFELLGKLKKNNSTFKSRNVIAQKLWTILIFEMWYKRFIDMAE